MYQGYHTVDDPSQVVPANLNPAATCFPPTLTANRLVGAEAYQFQIATTTDFAGPVYDLENSTNSKAPTGWTTWSVSTPYYWRSRAKVNGTWSDWPAEHATFTINTSDYGTIVPANAGTATETTPLLDWGDISGASGYELQYASTSDAVASATANTVTASQYQVSSALAEGTWYWRVRAKNADNVWGAWTSTWSFTIPYAIGDTGPAGGKIFYDKGSFSDGWRYLEVWTADESDTYQWKTSDTTTGGTSTTISTGEANTTAMAGTAHPAAERARNATYGGYDDWFLPSKDELNLVYIQRSVIGGFASDYWSSSEGGSSLACFQYFGNGYQGYYTKGSSIFVRLVRAF